MTLKNSNLGYPTAIEQDDGTIFAAYYGEKRGRRYVRYGVPLRASLLTHRVTGSPVLCTDPIVGREDLCRRSRLGFLPAVRKIALVVHQELGKLVYLRGGQTEVRHRRSWLHTWWVRKPPFQVLTRSTL